MKSCSVWIAVLLFGLSLVGALADTGTGAIEGKVLNGTEGGGSVSGLQVTLETYIGDIKQEGLLSAITDSEGAFSFADLPTDSSHAYVVSVAYQDVDYSSDSLTFGKSNELLSVEVMVFETTLTVENITILQAHMIIYVGAGELLVKESFLFSNWGDRTYKGNEEIETGGIGQTLRFHLPANAIGLQPGIGLTPDSIVLTGSGFADTAPLLPGMRQISYSYALTYELVDPIEVALPDYPLGTYDVLVNGDDIEVLCDQLTSGEPVTIQGQAFVRFSGSDLDPSTRLQLKISQAEDDGHPIIMWLLVVILPLIVVLTVATVVILKKRKPKPSPSEGPVDTDGVHSARQRLLLEIAQLDDKFEQGKILEDVYRRTRAEKKTELVHLMDRASTPDRL